MSNRTAVVRGPRRCLAATALVAMFAAAAPVPAGAIEIFGLRLFEPKEDPADEIIGNPQPYEVTFSVTGENGEIERQLKNASNLWADRDKPASGAAGLISKARGDYRRLLYKLYEDARYGGTISITVDGRQASDLLPDVNLASPAMVHIAVDPGPLFHFNDARIVNQAPPASDPNDAVEDPAKRGFRTGEPARSGTIIEAGQLAASAWQQQGHPKANVIERRVTAAHTTDTVDAVITVDPGSYAVFGPVTISGTDRMDPHFVVRQAGIMPGTEFDQDDLTKARQRLTRLDVFRSARIEQADAVTPEGTLPIHILVQERLPRRFGVGGSYSTLDGLGLEAFWLHRNLFGHAERLRIEGTVSGIGQSINPEDFTYRVGPTYTRPGIYTPETDFIASLLGSREVLDAYTRTGVSAELGITHQFTDHLSGRFLVNAGYASFEDDTFGTRRFTTAGFLGGIIYDTRDEPTDATRGFYGEVTLEPYYEFNYGNAAARLTVEGRTYYSLDDESRFVLAGRAKLGTLLQPPVAETPPDKLFFAGGGGSVRGYAFRSIGVDTPEGLIGGRSLIEGSVEMRARVTRSIGVVGFVDAAYVDGDAIPEFSEELRVGVGAGVRYQTGLGPIRLDLAVPLDRGPDDPAVAFYLGIGQAF